MMISMVAAESPIAVRPGHGGRRNSIFLPREHGSWSFVFEPLALGLLVAPSLAGGALAVTAAAAFFARRPLKAVLLGGEGLRHPGTLGSAVLLGTCGAIGLGEALVLGGLAPLWPLLLAAPLGALFLHFDRQNDSRSAAAEVSGSAAYGVLPAALAALAGWPAPAALALSATMLARGIPTVLTVRTYLRYRKSGASEPVRPLAAAAAAMIAVGLLWEQSLVPGVAPIFAAALLIRTVFLVTPLRPNWAARRVGLVEAALGIAYAGVIAFGWRAG
jgi:hypothetical protein